MRNTKVGGMVGVIALSLMLAASAAGGTQVTGDGDGRRVERRPAIATFEGRTLNLAESWAEARACLVWRQGGVLECFRSEQALEAREAQLGPRRAEQRSTPTSTIASYAYYSSSCSSSLRLYDYTWYGGRQLSFWDRGYWQNLSDYGFGDQTSSYIVGGCYAHLAEHGDGGGWWYPGPT
ncbi:MAG: hypothetical protein ACRD1D_07600, partial [Acidimicrobiales bacterium]